MVYLGVPQDQRLVVKLREWKDGVKGGGPQTEVGKWWSQACPVLLPLLQQLSNSSSHGAEKMGKEAGNGT